MANFYRNVTVKGVARGEIEQLLSTEQIDSAVSSAEKDCIAVCIELYDDTTAEMLSRQLNCVAFDVWNDGDRRLRCDLYVIGEQTFRYNSNLESGPHDEPANPLALCNAFGARDALTEIEQILSRTYVFETLRHEDLSKALGCCFTPVGLEDIKRGDMPEGFANLESSEATPSGDSFLGTPSPQTKSEFSSVDDSFLPRRDDLDKMNPRTAIALAVRAARRAQQRFLADTSRRSSRKFREAVERALLLAEDFANSVEPSGNYLACATTALHRVGEFADDVRYGDNSTGQIAGVLDVPGSVHSALLATTQAVYANRAPNGETQSSIRETVIATCYEAIRIGITTHKDWEIALSYCGECADKDHPLDCGEDGPFGAL